ncbi:hypothetical protein C8F04DRAFT_1400650 [Mycena alexandri]|uniref:Uncharacterized protein n=1 Tax=Mycena alexandri TaxID=1745969 RepID=A0AAD6WUK2_9AGAR|nr:hypothetical protein C8F04DRAFT_1400650 [Mycena alexandri]
MDSFSHLETLAVVAGEDQDHKSYLYYRYRDSTSYSLTQLVELLRLCTNLVECTLHNFTTLSEYIGTETVVLPSLVCLKLGMTANVHELKSEDGILKHLSLPSLETLFLPFNNISSYDFSLFLRRSSPPLRKLVIGDQCDEFSLDELDKWLHLVPSLEHIELYVRDRTFADDLFAALGDSQSDLLPKLRNLVIYHGFSTIFESAYQLLFQSLSNRRAKLELRNSSSIQAQCACLP